MLGIAEANRGTVVKYENFLEWLFGRKQEKIAMSSGTASLMRQLLAIEGDRYAEDRLLEKIQTTGCCMVVKVHIGGPDMIAMLGVYKYLRAVFAMQVWNADVCLIKCDGARFFIHAVTAAVAMTAALRVRVLTSKFGIWLDTLFPGKVRLKDMSCSIGIKDGNLLLIEGGCYGDAVNMASMFAESIAKPGELLIAPSCITEKETDPDMKRVLSETDQTRRRDDISGLDYASVTPKQLMASMLETTVTVPNLEETQGHLDIYAKPGDVDRKSCVTMTTDLRGFQRLVKQYGILHFLRLVLTSRSILVPAVIMHGGNKIRFEGDTMIAEFPSVEMAASAVAVAWKNISDFNNSRAKDFQIRIGCALCLGEVAILGQDIVGPGFDVCMYLARQIAEAGEILITPNMKQQAANAQRNPFAQVSEDRRVEGQDFKYCRVTLA